MCRGSTEGIANTRSTTPPKGRAWGYQADEGGLWYMGYSTGYSAMGRQLHDAQQSGERKLKV
jgi:hypothetical protein